MAKRKKKVSSNGVPKKEEGSTALDLRHKFGEQFQHASFCNHVTIQCDDKQEFHISFFEIQPPLFLGPLEERKDYLESLGHIDARCVGRIVISAGRMPGVVRALVENVVRNMPDAASEVLEALTTISADQGDS